MEIVGYISLFFVGLILGTLGGGGSILSVPILVYIFSLDAVTASAYSLFIVGITSLVGSILKYNDRMLSIRTGCIFGAPSVFAIFSTRRWLIPSIPDVILQWGSFQFTKRGMILGTFAILMILASIALITKKSNPKRQKGGYYVIYLALLGCLTGFVTGLVGVGGGFLIVPVLMYFTDLRFKTAVGTTLFIIAFNSLIGFMGDVINYSVNWQFLSIISCLAVLGIATARQSTQKISSHFLRIIFGCFALGMGIIILAKEVIFNT